MISTTPTPDELYLEHRSFIASCATKICRKYGCPQLLEDLISVGALALLERLPAYDAIRGAELTTFLYPHIMGAMRREVEANLGCMALPKRAFQHSRAAYHSLEALVEEGDGHAALQVAAPGLPVHREVYLKICIELMEEAFQSLSFREQEILGGFFGVFGYEKQTLAELGEQFSIKENAALKAKDAALQRLTALCNDGRLGLWREVYRAVMGEAQS